MLHAWNNVWRFSPLAHPFIFHTLNYTSFLFQSFKNCPPQILLGLFLNTLDPNTIYDFTQILNLVILFSVFLVPVICSTQKVKSIVTFIFFILIQDSIMDLPKQLQGLVDQILIVWVAHNARLISTWRKVYVSAIYCFFINSK